MAPSARRQRDPVPSHPPPMVDTSKPTAIFQPSGKGRSRTLTVALPGSIIANAVTQDAKTQLAGQIGRALAVFCVDEVVIFEDGTGSAGGHGHGHGHGFGQRRAFQDHHRPAEDDGARQQQQQYTGNSDPSGFLEHLLTFLETPPFLRRKLFPHHPNLAAAGLLPSLDMPHHLRADESGPYREGITVPSEGNDSEATAVDVGYAAPVHVSGIELAPGIRVTVKAADERLLSPGAIGIRASICHPREPRESIGLYWGFSVRRASCLSAVFTESPFASGYDISIGTSERGKPMKEFVRDRQDELKALAEAIEQPVEEDGARSETATGTGPVPDLRAANPFQHLVIFFGGVAGLEPAVRADPDLPASVKAAPADVFDHWLDVLPGQGSRTIRTEEALWLTIGQLDPWING